MLLMKKSASAPISTRPLPPGIEWSLKATAEASLRAASDGLQVPLASTSRQRSVGKVGGNAQSAGFGQQLFSPGGGTSRLRCLVVECPAQW